MRALLDINVIVALLDPDHVFHDRAHRGWETYAKRGWASCPLTENCVVRIMAHPAYSASVRFTPGDLIAGLTAFAAQSDHGFWPDVASLRNPEVFIADRIHGSRQITDLYLLAVAVKIRGGWQPLMKAFSQPGAMRSGSM